MDPGQPYLQVFTCCSGRWKAGAESLPACFSVAAGAEIRGQYAPRLVLDQQQMFAVIQKSPYLEIINNGREKKAEYSNLNLVTQKPG